MPELTCPSCNGVEVHRSRRKSLIDYALALCGLYPYRCAQCLHRWRRFGNYKETDPAPE